MPGETTDNREKLGQALIDCAEMVLPIFEREYPSDGRARKAIEAAKAYWANPSCGTLADVKASYLIEVFGANTADHAAEAAAFAGKFCLPSSDPFETACHGFERAYAAAANDWDMGKSISARASEVLAERSNSKETRMRE